MGQQGSKSSSKLTPTPSPPLPDTSTLGNVTAPATPTTQAPTDESAAKPTNLASSSQLLSDSSLTTATAAKSPPKVTEPSDKSDLDNDAPLFDERLLDAAIVAEAAEQGLRIRPLRRSDFSRGHVDLLGQLTTTGEVTEQQYKERFDLMRSVPNTYYIVVIEDIASQQLVATGSVIIEFKFTRSCGKVGHIEDIVTTMQRRGQHLGKRIITQLKHVCHELGCYKVILDTAEKNEGFYATLGFQRKENQMALYF